MSAKEESALRIERLSIRFPSVYGSVAVLDDINMTVDFGESVGVVGESGSGKSLLGLAAVGLLPTTANTSGAVYAAGYDMLNLPPRQASLVRGGVVSHIYQDALSALNPNRRIGSHFRDIWLSASAQPRDGWKKAALEMLDRVALRMPDRILQLYPDQLSGGMRQRVLIALALFRRPTLLIADEPTTALDRSTAGEVLSLLNDLRQTLGMAMILISHDFSTVRVACDRVAVIYAGQLCEVGTLGELLTQPIHQYTHSLLESVRSLQRSQYPLASIAGVVPTPQEFGEGCRFLGRCAAGTDACADDRDEVCSGEHRAWCTHPVNHPVNAVTQAR
jgi:peptide/nickel transport system ATP-binding protein/peptide/nickel transport system permease protein